METWKTLHNFPGYEGSTDGRIRNIRTQHILKQCPDKYGRMKVSLQRNGEQKSTKVHKVIAETYYGEHPGMDVRHKDSDLANNRADNLEWVTRSETISEAYRRGSKKPYQSRPVRVVETGRTYDSIKECALDTGCDKSQISKQLAGGVSHVKGYHFEIEDSHS